MKIQEKAGAITTIVLRAIYLFLSLPPLFKIFLIKIQGFFSDVRAKLPAIEF